MLDTFTFDAYRDLLRRVGDGRENLCFRDFSRPISAERFFILRHDVDFFPERALDLARIEATQAEMSSDASRFGMTMDTLGAGLGCPNKSRVPPSSAAVASDLVLAAALLTSAAIPRSRIRCRTKAGSG